MPIVAEVFDYVVGVDTHTKHHVFTIVAAGTGAVTAPAQQFPVNAAGLTRAIDWIGRNTNGRVLAAIEGTGSYGATLTRRLLETTSIQVTDVAPLARRHRGGKGKTDSLDSARAAHGILRVEIADLAEPKQGSQRSDLQVLLTVRTHLLGNRTALRNMLNALVRTLGLLADTRRTLTDAQVRAIAAGALDPQMPISPLIREQVIAVAQELKDLTVKINDNEKQLRKGVQAWRPELLEVAGVGPISAAILLYTWSHHGRFVDDAHFASLCGVSPVPVNSGDVQGIQRLNRTGDRTANSALDTIIRARLRYDATTRAYSERRLAEVGMTKRKIKRILKRYLARQLFKLLETRPTATLGTVAA